MTLSEVVPYGAIEPIIIGFSLCNGLVCLCTLRWAMRQINALKLGKVSVSLIEAPILDVI